MKNTVRECDTCVMSDSVDPQIRFFGNRCEHCLSYEERIQVRLAPAMGSNTLAVLAERIRRKAGKGKYDCVVGLSGGVDSSYLAMLIAELGLNPLCVHIDNGWNSELASSNIEKVVKGLNLDLYTVVLDAETFHDIQKAFLLSSVPDVEIPTDHAIQAGLWRTAAKFKIRTIISGMNFASESSSIPHWSYGHADWRYIRSVWQLSGNPEPSKYPHFSKLDLLYWTFARRIRSVSLLNYIDYQKDEAVGLLKSRLGWEEYSSKHFESIYTRWTQGFFLPTKFKIDKRYMHLSDLIRAGQLTKSAAMEALGQENYRAQDAKSDTSLVLKKLGLEPDDLEEILSSSTKTYRDFPNSARLDALFRSILNLGRRAGLYPR